jgi:hypothetical protein
MEIKELKYEVRLGNYVYINDKITKLECLDIDIYDQNYPTDSAKPIPLTEEVLLRCGFIKFNSDIAKNYFDWFLNFEGVLKYRIIQSERGFVYPSSYKPIILRHLHQLQNLYFAFTGEELTYNHSPSI